MGRECVCSEKREKKKMKIQGGRWRARPKRRQMQMVKKTGVKRQGVRSALLEKRYPKHQPYIKVSKSEVKEKQCEWGHMLSLKLTLIFFPMIQSSAKTSDSNDDFCVSVVQ